MVNNNKIYFKNLDSIRFFAALMVFLLHGFSTSYKYLNLENKFFEKLLYTLSDGEAGVSIFFVLSGFLITYLLINEYEQNLKISIKNFYMRRILRIWPLYFLVIFFAFCFYPFLKTIVGLNKPLASNIFYHLTFLSNFDVINIQKHAYANEAMSQNITWSVSIEEQFYLFWPLLFVFLPKRAWLYSILIVIAGSIAFRCMHYNDGIILYFHTFSVLLDLGIGGLVALLIKTNKKTQLFFENTSTITHIIFFAVSFCLLFFRDTFFAFHYGKALGRVFISISFVLIIAAQAITKSKSALNLGNISFANKWGKYTYGIYLIHPIAITLVDVLFRLMHIAKNNFYALFFMGILSYILTLFLSQLSYNYFESKFISLKEKFSTPRLKE